VTGPEGEAAGRLSAAEIDAMLRKAGLGGRIVNRRAVPGTPPFTQASQARAAMAREKARLVRAEWLLKLSAGDTDPAGAIRAACTPDLSGPLRRLRLDHVMRAHEHAGSLSGIHARLALVHARSGAPGRWCAGPHPRTSPKAGCDGFHPSTMTLGWLLATSARGRRLRAWAGLYASVHDGFPRRRRPPPAAVAGTQTRTGEGETG
jgi:hypothetical protein